MSVRCLSFHASYRCGNSGACCTSRWPIPVEAPLRERLDEATRTGALTLPNVNGVLFREDEDLPPGMGGVLRLEPSGACSCYDAPGRRCVIHAQLGHEALPVSCQIFPRVCLLDEEAVSVSLSHYCPTAASLLFADDMAPAVVTAPPRFAPMPLEGLDARGALPPLLHPAMLMDREAYRRWEEGVVAFCGREAGPAEALRAIVEFTERVRRWTPREGALADTLAAAVSEVPLEAGRPGPSLSNAALRLDALVRAAVPAPFAAAAAPVDAPALFERLAAPSWAAFAAPIRRYLAAKAFGSWCAYQGRGLRTVTASLVAALSVLYVEAARHCGEAGRALDAALLKESFRSADLLIVHLASREELARSLGELEEAGVEELLAAL